MLDSFGNEIEESKLTDSEKKRILNITFKKTSNNISNVGNLLAESFDKIDGFDYKWNSLITSTPLLFEDIDYLRVMNFINNKITPSELEAYQNNHLTHVYATFENMLICNLQYYDRIMSFCTLVFLHYVRIYDDIYTDSLDKLPYVFELTPTQIWCCALTSPQSTEYEIEYGWKSIDKSLKFTRLENISFLEQNFNTLNSFPFFKKHIEYAAVRNNSDGFRETFIADVTTNRKLSTVCNKFTKLSQNINEDELDSLYSFIYSQENINKKLYSSLYLTLKKMYNGDDKMFAIFVFNTEFFISTVKYKMRVYRNEKGFLAKEYISNSYECFIAEECLVSTIKVQLEWAKFEIPAEFDSDKTIMTNLLTQMLNKNYRKTECLKLMGEEEGVLARISFTGMFEKVYIWEEYKQGTSIIYSNKTCLSKENAAKYIIAKGYYIFGEGLDIWGIGHKFSKNKIKSHYAKYCVSAMQYMADVIETHQHSNKEIIDVMINGLHPEKLNRNILYTSISTGQTNKTGKKIMSEIIQKQTKTLTNKKTYWGAIEK